MQTYADTCRQQGKFHTQNSKHSATFILQTSMTVKRHLNAKTFACRLHHKESGARLSILITISTINLVWNADCFGQSFLTRCT